MITRLKVSNFKSLRELECEFGRLTVIVGPNGCGKSSVLQAISVIRQLCSGADERLWISSSPANGTAQGQCRFEMHIEPSIVFTATFTPHSRSHEGDEWKVRLGLDAEPIDLFPKSPRGLRESLQYISFYHLDKTIMERPTFSDAPNPTLGQRGENLASVLDAMQGEQREQFEAIEKDLRDFIPDLRAVRLQRVREQDSSPKLGHQVVLEFEFARHVVAEHASEGTILLLGLLTVIGTQPATPITIMLDDLDRGLHPRAQKQLIAHLHALLDRRPDLQIIATTHSPYLVEHLKYDEVLAMTQNDGRSLIAPLAKHPDADRWRDEMSAGEFWSSVGEDWIAGERQ